MVTILIDAREKKPFRFPDHLILGAPRRTVALSSLVASLDTGDYQLQGAPDAACVERKASLRELAGNLLTPTGRRRFLDELDRLRSSFRFPCVLIEGTPQELERSAPPGTDPAAVRDLLWSALMSYTMPCYFFPCATDAARQKAVEWAASYLILGAITNVCPRNPGQRLRDAP